jgi:hypothetical protein
MQLKTGYKMVKDRRWNPKLSAEFFRSIHLPFWKEVQLWCTDKFGSSIQNTALLCFVMQSMDCIDKLCECWRGHLWSIRQELGCYTE